MSNKESVKKSTAYQNVCSIMSEFQVNSANFCSKIGVNRNYVSDLKSGNVGRLSDKIIDKILLAFPGLSRSWLLTGEGNMWATPMSNNQSNMTVAGDNLVNGSKNITEGMESLIATNAKLAETLQQQSEHIGRLISIIENKL